MSELPLLSIEGLSKRYRPGPDHSLVPVPRIFRPGYRDLSADRSRESEIDEDEDDDDEVDEVDEEEPQPAPQAEVWALRDVTLDLAPGAAMGVVGPNAAGKTTLLKVLARITPPTEGRIVVRGRVAPMLALATGFMHPERTGPANVRLLGQLLGVPREVVERRMRDVLAFAQVEGAADAPLKRYSSGMARRLAFSVALNLEPDVLLSDGTLTVGDADFRRRCTAAVREANAAGVAILFASHDLKAVADLCSEAIWLDSGRVRLRGAADEVVAAYEESQLRRKRQAAARAKQRAARPGPGAAILEVRVRAPDRRPIEVVSSDEAMAIEMDLHIAEPANIGITFMLASAEGPPIKILAPREWGVAAPGTFTAVAEVAAGDLPGGRYTGAAGVLVEIGERRLKLSKRAAFVLEVEDGPGAVDADVNEHRVLVEALRWDLYS